MNIVLGFILLVIAMTLSNLLAQWAQMFYMRHKHMRCGTCGKKSKPIFVDFSPPCEECSRKAAEEYRATHETFNVPVHFGSDGFAEGVVEGMKHFSKNPELLKEIRKGLGLQSERERFEEEASE